MAKKKIVIKKMSMLDYLSGRHTSPMAVFAQRKGNASGQHGSSKYQRRNRKQSRIEKSYED